MAYVIQSVIQQTLTVLKTRGYIVERIGLLQIHTTAPATRHRSALCLPRAICLQVADGGSAPHGHSGPR